MISIDTFAIAQQGNPADVLQPPLIFVLEGRSAQGNRRE
jgi:hypothetical protein